MIKREWEAILDGSVIENQESNIESDQIWNLNDKKESVVQKSWRRRLLQVKTTANAKKKDMRWVLKVTDKRQTELGWKREVALSGQGTDFSFLFWVLWEIIKRF